MINIDYYLAIDIGASSGRHILGHIENGKIVIEEIYRFSNGMIDCGGSKVWNLQELFNEIKNGLKKCGELNRNIVSMGIDTWAVDYVLLDENDNVLGKSYGYRDERTENMDNIVYSTISKEDLYKRTGIQKQIFNTIYQLMAHKTLEEDLFKKAKTFLMLPDFFNFLLTGVKMSEYTNATSTQLVSKDTNDWDIDLIEKLGFDKNIFLPLKMPKTIVGNIKDEIAKEIGFTTKVVLPATHDTASAVVAVPITSDDCIYISSGTWSLMGVENTEAICTTKSMEANFTNEGGYDYRFRFLKNIMGLWIIQSVKREFNDEYSFSKICELAEIEKDFPSRINVNDSCFLSPKNMILEIQNYCKNTNQIVPKTIGEIATVVYQSLAECYSETAKEIEKITNQKYNKIQILGGGANAEYLNQLTEKVSGKNVYKGPVEATAIGNLVVQMLSDNVFKSLEEARESIFHSF